MYDNKRMDNENNIYDCQHIRSMLSNTNTVWVCQWNDKTYGQQYQWHNDNIRHGKCDDRIVCECGLLCEWYSMQYMWW